MKRSYPYQGHPQGGASAGLTNSYNSFLQQPNPPLPPGPPPPPPGPNAPPFQSYAPPVSYANQQTPNAMAPHPQYPNYGYGGQTQQHIAPPVQQPQATTYYPQPPAQQPSYGQQYPNQYQQYQQPSQQPGPYPNPQAQGYYPPPTNYQQPSYPPQGPFAHPQPAQPYFHQRQPSIGPQQTPPSGPPNKKARYSDPYSQQHPPLGTQPPLPPSQAPQPPPPALPPLPSSGGGSPAYPPQPFPHGPMSGGGVAGNGTNRGGRGGRGGAFAGRGGGGRGGFPASIPIPAQPASGSSDVNATPINPTRTFGGLNGGPGRNMPAAPPPSAPTGPQFGGFGSADRSRGGMRGRGADRRGGAEPHHVPAFAARGSSGGVMLGVGGSFVAPPKGNRNQCDRRGKGRDSAAAGRGMARRGFGTDHASRMGGRGGRGGRAGRGAFATPDGRFAKSTKSNGRIWGNEGPRDTDLERSKGTLTDFRISGLEIVELGWTWKAELPASDRPGAETVGDLKDNGKHARDDDEEDKEDDPFSERQGAKKAKISDAQDGLEVVQEAQVIQEPVADKETDKADDSDSDVASASVVPKVEGTPTKPRETSATPNKPVSYSSPIVPFGRENSRLRIYFASPFEILSAANRHHAVRQDEIRHQGMKDTPTPGEKDVDMPETWDSEAPIEAGHEAGDVDGEPLNSPMKEEEHGPALEDGIKEEMSSRSLDGESSFSGVDAKREDREYALPSGGGDEGQELVPVESTGAPSTAHPTGQPQPQVEVTGESDAAPSDTTLTEGAQESQPKPESEGQTEGTALSFDFNRDLQTPEPGHDQDAHRPEPCPDRISISYAKNTRRLVLDAEVVERVKIFRGDAKIEVSVKLRPTKSPVENGSPTDPFRICEGILVEVLDPDLDDYTVVDRASLEAAWKLHVHDKALEDNSKDLATDSQPKNDPLLPPLHELFHSVSEGRENDDHSTEEPKFDRVTIIAALDRSNPLTETRWVRSGDPDGWLAQLGTNSRVSEGDRLANLVESGWKGKIEVVDPDAPLDFQHALDAWKAASSVSTAENRSRFASTHMKDPDNVIEVILRLVRGDRGLGMKPAPAQQSILGTLAPGVLLSHAEQQTSISLAVFSLFKLSVDMAAKAGLGRESVDAKVSEIVRAVPYALVYKALDSLMREWIGK